MWQYSLIIYILFIVTYIPHRRPDMSGTDAGIHVPEQVGPRTNEDQGLRGSLPSDRSSVRVHQSPKCRNSGPSTSGRSSIFETFTVRSVDRPEVRWTLPSVFFWVTISEHKTIFQTYFTNLLLLGLTGVSYAA